MVSILGSSYPPIGTSSSYGAASTTKSSGSKALKTDADTIADFLAFQKMSPEKKIREAILKKLGITEDNLKAMSPQRLKDVEEKITEEMKQMINGKMAEKGIIVDILA